GTSSGVYTETLNVTGTETTISGLPHWRYFFAISANGPDWESDNSTEVGVLTNIGPTSAGIIISGRVITPLQYGIPNARIVITDSNGEVVKTALTNPFGYYRIEN